MNLRSIINLVGFVLSFAYADPSQELLKAVKSHDIAGMKTAITAGADVNTKDEGGDTPRNCAIWWPDEVKLLI